jgi:hypothetical protein
MSLDTRVRDRGYDNVRFIRSASGNFTNFRMRAKQEEDVETAEALDMEVNELPPELQSGHRAHLRLGPLATLCHIYREEAVGSMAGVDSGDQIPKLCREFDLVVLNGMERKPPLTAAVCI